MAPILSVQDLNVTFDVRRQGAWPWTPSQPLQAVGGLAFDLQAGETLGVVGESGSGKSTLARAIVGTVPTSSGRIIWKGDDLAAMTKQVRRKHRRDVQMIFQDPLAALNPRMNVGEIIAEPLTTHEPHISRAEVKRRVGELMERVGLLPNLVNRYPHEFSGGQCQRIGIARALILKPELVICDEPVSALDVSVQAQVVNLLRELQRDMGLAMIFIAHDLSVVKHISDRILVMYLGRQHQGRVRQDAAPLHAGADFVGADPRSGGRKGAPSPDPRGRVAITPQPAIGLCLSHPLPQGPAILRGRSARVAGCWQRSSCGLPLSGGAKGIGHNRLALRQAQGSVLKLCGVFLFRRA